MRPRRDLYERFLALGDASGEEIVAFAKAFGPLNLCRHDLPHFHEDQDPDDRCKPLGRELIGHWRQWSHRCLALHNVGLKLQSPNGRLPSPTEWRGFSTNRALVDDGAKKVSRAEQRIYFAEELSGLFRATGIRPMFVWLKESPRITVGGRFGVLSAVVLQIAEAMIEERLYLCDFCGAPHHRERAPKANHLAKCGVCQRTRPDKKRKRRAKGKKNG